MISFPTRRSSDLSCHRHAGGAVFSRLAVREMGLALQLQFVGRDPGPDHRDVRRRRGRAERGLHRPVLFRARSEEHTSELQSPCNLVCRFLLEKDKNDLPIKGLAALVEVANHWLNNQNKGEGMWEEGRRGPRAV